MDVDRDNVVSALDRVRSLSSTWLALYLSEENKEVLVSVELQPADFDRPAQEIFYRFFLPAWIAAKDRLRNGRG